MMKDETFNVEWLFIEQKDNPGENLNSIMQKNMEKYYLKINI